MIDYFEHIDDYKSGNISAELKSGLEAAMLEDADLKAAVDNYDIAKGLAGAFIEEETRSILEGLEDSTTASQSKPGNIKQVIIIAFAAAFLAAFGYVIGKKIKGNTEPVGYAYTFEEPIWPIERGEETDLLSKGINVGLNGDVQKAKELIGQAEIGLEAKNLWISELFAYNKMPDSIAAYLPDNLDGQETQYRIEYLKVIALKSDNDLDALDEYMKRINAEENPYLINLLKD